MRRIFNIFLILLFVMSFTFFSSCSNESGQNGNNEVTNTTNSDTGNVDDKDDYDTETSETGNPSTDDAGKEDSDANNNATGKTLIVYFSCTGTTEKVAGFVAENTNGTLLKIEAKIPYTADDLKYYTDCRADKEQNDATARPEIANTIDGFSDFYTIYIGYPIWHGQAPKIIYTFLESYDFSGKTIVPFCTSASSGIGSSDTNLHPLATTADWKSGKRFSSSTTKADIADWIGDIK